MCALPFSPFSLSRLLRAAGLAACLLPAASHAGDALQWRSAIEIAAGAGEKGPWRQNDSRYDYVDDPALAIDDQGSVAIAWVEQAKKDVFFQRIPPDGARRPAQPVNVSRSPDTFSWLPRVLISRHDQRKVFIVWQEIIFSGASHGGEIFFARSEDGGASFSPPRNVSNLPGGDGKGRIHKDFWHNGSYDLAEAPDGTLYIAWTEYDGPLWLSRSTDGGVSFSPPRQIAGSKDSPARAPSLAAGADGALYLAWTVGEDDAADIRVARSNDGGASFDRPLIVGRSPNYSDAPRLATDAAGTLHLVYAESSGGPFERYRIRHARSTDGARSFSEPREIGGPLPAPAVSAAFPALAIDAGGTLYVLAELYPDPKQPPRGLGLTVSRDGGRSFAPWSLVPDSIDARGGFNGSHQGLLMQKLAVNGGGTVAVGNSALQYGRRSRVWLMRGESRH